MMPGRQPRFASLRFKTLALLTGSAAIAISTALAMIWSIRQVDFHVERAALSQIQLESLIQLSGSVAKYRLVATESARAGADRAPMQAAASEVSQVFDALDSVVERQVNLLGSDEEKNAEASEGLGIARMRAMFQGLDRQIYQAMERGGGAEATDEQVRRVLDVFAFGMSPVLSQSIEDDRNEARQARLAVDALKSRATVVAALLCMLALGLAVFLYLGPVRSILKRLSETVTGAGALAAGRFDTRLALSGDDELTSLMAGLNRMAGNLAQRENEVVRAQRELQSVITQRTLELTEANDRLASVDADRRRFFADVSHELRTPLTVILGEAEVTLRGQGDLPAACRRSLETIHARARRLNRRVEDLLRIARSESGRIELKLARVELGAVLAEAVEDTLALARRKTMTLTLDRGPGILHVNGDRDWLRQVAGGLIGNAVKYAPEGTEVHVSAFGSGDEACFAVADSGPGIAEEERELVFDRFYRGRRDGLSSEPGHGVGLALARWVVGEHKGIIAIENASPATAEPGAPVGTRVVVRLTLADALEDFSRVAGISG